MRPPRRLHQFEPAESNYETELTWLRDRGVRIDEKGRIIVSLPTPDDEDELCDRDEEEASITELMRREVGRRDGGSRGRRRRSVPKASQRMPARSAHPVNPPRVGRPAIGAEVRVYVQTTISPQTRETITRRGLTLADVLDKCAQELADDV